MEKDTLDTDRKRPAEIVIASDAKISKIEDLSVEVIAVGSVTQVNFKNPNNSYIVFDGYNQEFTILNDIKDVRLRDGRFNVVNGDCSKVESLTVSSSQFHSFMLLPFTGLKSLEVKKYIHLDWSDEKLYETLSNVEEMEVGNFTIPSGNGFRKLKSLQTLRVDKLDWGTIGSDMAPPTLKTLTIDNCHFFQCDPDLVPFTQLKELILNGLTKNPHFCGLSHLKSIERLTLSANDCITISIENLIPMYTLKELSLYSIMIEVGEPTQCLIASLEKLEIRGRDAISDEFIHWDILEYFPNLLEMRLKGLGIRHKSDDIDLPTCLPVLNFPKNLKKYKLSYCRNFMNGYFPEIKVGYDE
jgi:Leucine-rich repeat (LRR) protein